jgi:acyl-CoA synthetase (AMP-forming)/AMP-acid ligase II
MTHHWRRYANNPARWVAFRAQRAPDAAAFSAWEGETITYGSLHERAAATAAGLAARGITRGMRVAFVGENETSLLVLVLVLALATWRLGSTFVPLNYRCRRDRGSGRALRRARHRRGAPVAGRTVVLDELREAARPHLAGYKLPRRLEVVAELPRNANGKILKRELKNAIASRENGC